MSGGKNIDLLLKTTLSDDRDISDCQHNSTSQTSNPHGDVGVGGGGMLVFFLFNVKYKGPVINDMERGLGEATKWGNGPCRVLTKVFKCI